MRNFAIKRIMVRRNKILIMFVFVSLIKINDVFSQVWETKDIATEMDYHSFKDVYEQSDGDLICPTNYFIKSSSFDVSYSRSPGVVMLNKNGEEIARNNFFRPGYCTLSHSHIFEKDNSIYYLTTYSPEHTPGTFNNFANYDNPPTDAKLSLFKLDNQLDIEEIYEHSWPIDTFQATNTFQWQMNPNGYSGNLFLFSAFEEDGNIVGAYWKCYSFRNPEGGEDTLFLFKMNFDGEILLKKDIDYVSGHRSIYNDKGAQQTSYFTDRFVVTDYGYILYLEGDGTDPFTYLGRARALYYDKKFNLLKTKYLRSNDVGAEVAKYISVKRSDHNTTYLSSSKIIKKNGVNDIDCRLHEINDDINETYEGLDVVNYIDRGTDIYDCPSNYSSIDFRNNDTIYYAYTLGTGSQYNTDSWIVIERLNRDLDTISTLYYGVEDGKYNELYNIVTTNDGGFIITQYAESLLYGDYGSVVAKFSSSAFDNIEETHANGLKVAVAYPNPGGNVMNIRTSLRNCTLNVYDMQGRIVHQQEITDEITSIDASQWSSGTYFWQLGTEDGNGILESGKWVK